MQWYLSNHESPKRGDIFLISKVTLAAARFCIWLRILLLCCNLNAQRDSGHAKDYIEGVYFIKQQDKSEYFVFATDIPITIHDFVKLALAELVIELGFMIEGVSAE